MKCAFPDCVNEFDRLNKNGGGHNRIYCSRVCNVAATMARLHKVVTEARDKLAPVKCSNIKCDILILPIRFGGNVQKFCSRRCLSTDRSRRGRLTRTPEKQAQYDVAIHEWQKSTHGRYKRLVQTSRNRKIALCITEQEYESLVSLKFCFYCGLDAFEKSAAGSGIDRYDRLKGYTLDNCRLCCWRCNEIKGSLERWFLPERSIELLKEAIGDSHVYSNRCCR